MRECTSRGLVLVLAMLTTSAGLAQTPPRRERRPPARATPATPPATTPPVAARDLHQQGQAAYAAGRYEESLVRWQAAFNLEPRAGIQYNLSQAYGRLGRLPEERAALVRYLEMLERESPERLTDPQSQSARERILTIDDRLANTAIVVRGAPRRARVFLDGQEVTLTEGAVLTPAGSHALRVEVPGYAPFQTAVNVGHGERVEVDVELELATETSSSDVREALRRRHRRVAIGLASSGLAALGVGTTFGILAVGSARGSYVGSADASRARPLGIGADVGFGVGGALTTTAFILWRVHRGDSETTPSVVPVVTSRSLGVAGRF